MNSSRQFKDTAESASPAGLSSSLDFHSGTVRRTEGHRWAMRQRLLNARYDALADHELLEMALFLALPRRDSKPMGKALLARFGSFGAVISVPVAELMRINGLGEAGTAALKLVQAASLRLLRQDAAAEPVFTNWDRLIDYLTATMVHEPTEQVRILFLDTKSRLIADEVHTRGTINRTAVYPREIARRCLELHATSVILAHNHPSGEPVPSREDVTMTAEIHHALTTMGIELYDHIIVARSRCLSFRKEKLLEDRH